MKMIYVIPEIPPSNNQFLGRETVWDYRKEKKRWADLVALFCRPRPDKPIKKRLLPCGIIFQSVSGGTLTIIPGR